MLVKFSLSHAKIEKIPEKIFVMINKDGVETSFRFYEEHNCYEGEHRAHEGSSQSPLGKTLKSHVVWQSVNKSQATLQMTGQAITKKCFAKMNLNQ